MVEEAREIAAASEAELVKEIGDVYEVLDALIAAFGLSVDDIRAVQERRRGEREGLRNASSWSRSMIGGRLALDAAFVLCGQRRFFLYNIRMCTVLLYRPN